MSSMTFLRRCGVLLTALSGFNSSAFAQQPEQFASFDVQGTTAFMRGEIGEPTLQVVSDLLEQNPQLNKIVMTNVPGSDDDDTNVKASLLVHKRGLTTYLPHDSMIASGGVDFFLAGQERIIEEGACVGVHAWQDDDDPTPAGDLPRDHPGHQIFLDYFDKIGMDPEFYWYTLRVAKSENMYWMSTEELLRYKVATKIIKPETDGRFGQLICEHR